MSTPDPGWHPHPKRRKTYRYWDGTSWTFSLTGSELLKHRRVGSVVPGADVHAPVHGPQPRRALALPALSKGERQGIYAACVAVVAVVTWAVARTPIPVVLVVGAGVVVGLLAWPTDSMRRDNARFQTERELRAGGLQPDPDGGPPRCPKCGGTQFKLRRSGGQRAAVGTATALFGVLGLAAGAAGTRQLVQCVTCAQFYDRIE